MTDNRDIGREMAADRDFILVTAANNGVDCREQLEAANARIAELRKQFIHEQALLNAAEHEISILCARAEAAERKLATATKVLEFYKNKSNWKRRVWGAIESPSRVKEDRGSVARQALAQIEQPQGTPAGREEPQQQLPGEDSDETCMCSACAALRAKSNPCSG